MRRLAGYFLRGLLVTAPAALTVYCCWVAIRFVDQLVGSRIPGLGLLAAVAVITMVGALASTLVARSVGTALDGALARLPFVRLLYASTKDLLNAFVGEQRRFSRPVRARFGQGDHAFFVLGFVTADSLGHLGLAGHVAVYLPFSYSVAGHVILLPADRVQPLDTDSADTMAFLISGGVVGSAAER